MLKDISTRSSLRYLQTYPYRRANLSFNLFSIVSLTGPKKREGMQLKDNF